MAERQSNSIQDELADHSVDAICALTIGAIALFGEPTAVTVGALTSIALGKRVLGATAK